MVVGYGIKIFWLGLFITSPDHLEDIKTADMASDWLICNFGLWSNSIALFWFLHLQAPRKEKILVGEPIREYM